MTTKVSTPKRGVRASEMDLQIKKILVPVDFSAAGRPALRHARFLARLSGASVLLLHVVEPPALTPEFGYIPPDKGQRQEHLTRLIGVLQIEEFDGVRTDFAIAEGHPFERIVQAASQAGADLIVMASHGYTGLRRILIGSTAERVIRYASCPVLIVRSPPKAGARRGSRKKRPHPRRGVGIGFGRH